MGEKDRMTAQDLFAGDGEMSARMRAHDWSATPVGPAEHWPQSLKTAVRMLLDCRLPMYLAWGPDLTQFYNDAYRPILGEKHEQALGNDARVTWQEIWPTIGPMWEEVMAGRPVGFDDFRLTIERYGFPEDCYFNFSYSAVPDDGGAPCGVLATFVETTDQVRNEARRTFLLDLSDTLAAMGGAEDITPAAARKLGEHLALQRVLYAEVSGRDFEVHCDWTCGVDSLVGGVRQLAAFGPELIAMLARNEIVIVEDAATDPRLAGQRAVYEGAGIRSKLSLPLVKDGRLAALLSLQRSTPHHWSAYEIELAREVGERTWSALENARAQAELRAERDRSRYIFDTMNEGFAIIAADWTVTSMNAEGLRIVGKRADEVVGQNHWDLFPATLGSEIEGMLRRAQSNGVACAGEVAFDNPEFDVRWVELRVFPEPGGGLAVFFRDITQRRDTEDRLKEADRRKDEFLAMLAHELRNPLAPIGAAAELLQFARLAPEQVRRTSEVIGRQVRHMTGLVDDLLDVSRVTRGLVTLEMRRLDVAGIVQDAVEQVRPLAESRRHQLTVRLAPEAAFVFGDQKRLVQVVANLLNNAAKYTPDGGSIELRAELTPGHVMFAVSDNGVGMAPELAERAFELFVQAKRASDRSQGGLGIGLALVRSLVELHNGSVTAHSEGLGKGSRFTVCLPRVGGGAPPGERERSAPEPGVRPLRIFVVDDNADAAVMLSMFLEAVGHLVMVETDPHKALARIAAERPDVCLLDIGLPEIDGYELARRIRADAGAGGPVLIALTGYGREEDRQAALEAGFAHHFVKPVDSARLENLLREIGEGVIGAARPR